MKDKKGFTLIELLGALILMLLISYVTFSIVVERMKETTDELDKGMLAVIYASAADYVAENINSFPKTDGEFYCSISLQRLVDEGFLKITLKNPNTGEAINPSKIVKVTIADNKYNYELIDKDTNGCIIPE